MRPEVRGFSGLEGYIGFYEHRRHLSTARFLAALYADHGLSPHE